MKTSNFSDAQKAFILKQGSDGMPVAEFWRKAGISQAIFFNWKRKYDGLLPTEMCRLKHLARIMRNKRHGSSRKNVQRISGHTLCRSLHWRSTRFAVRWNWPPMVRNSYFQRD